MLFLNLFFFNLYFGHFISFTGRGGGDNHTRIEAFARNKPVAQPIPDYLRIAFENYSSGLCDLFILNGMKNFCRIGCDA